LGASAFQAMIQFMAEGIGKTSSETKLVPISITTPYASDVSVFAVTQLVEGLGKANIGGFSQVVQLEVPIFHPLLSTFLTAPVSPTSVQNRFYNHNTTFGGDSIFLGAMMSSILSSSKWGIKRAPRFHAVDFLEFLDVLSQWVVGVVQAYNNDAETTLAVDVGFAAGEKRKGATLQPPSGICPLTQQEVGLLLLNAIKNLFSSSFTSTMNLYPRLPESGSDNQFIPYVSSATTCPIAMQDMVLPVPLIENLRALVMRAVPTQKNINDVQLYVPVLGQYALDTLDPDNYTVTIGLNPPTNVFSSSTQMVRRSTDKKGVVVSTPLVETAISYIDGNASSSFVFINDPGRLKALTMLWNTWFATQNLSAFSCQTGQLSNELGIAALTSISMTRHWLYESLEHVAFEKEFVDLRLEANRAVTDTVYSQRMAIADTSQSVILSAPYESVLNKWILPINFSSSGATYSDQSIVQRWQFLEGEPFIQPTTSGNDGVSIAEQHSSYAQKMVKAKNAPPNDWDELFAKMASESRGGVLSGIGGFLDSLIGI